MKRFLSFFFCTLFIAASLSAAEPVKLIFDTDLGNDVDDAMAIAVIHALQNRGECELLGITVTKDNKYVAPFAQVLNTFYGREDIPIAVVKGGVTPEDGRYNRQVLELKDAAGKPVYPYTLPNELPEAVTFLRKTLAGAEDNSIVLVQVGFFTNFARLLDTPGDTVSPLTGKELVAKKVKLLSLMAGAFLEKADFKEYNVRMDIPSAQKMIAQWPTEMVFSGHKIGTLVRQPPKSMQDDYNYVPNHPVKDAYRFYRGGLDKTTNMYDLTAVLYAVRPDRGYFGLSPKGTVTVHDNGITTFEPNENGKHRYMTLTPEQTAQTREALVQLCSEPPKTK